MSKKQTSFTCTNCGSNQTYYRVNTKDRRCIRCGHTWKNKEVGMGEIHENRRI